MPHKNGSTVDNLANAGSGGPRTSLVSPIRQGNCSLPGRGSQKGENGAGNTGCLGLHQGFPAGGTQNLSNCNNTPQVEAILIHPGLVISPAPKARGYSAVGKCNHYQNGPKGCYRPARSLANLHHPCLCGGQKQRPYLYGKMGHKGRFLADGRGGGSRMEFLLCFAPAPRPNQLPCSTHLTLNGVGGVTSVLLRGI